METDRGVAKTWKGNYSDYLAQKQTTVTAQLAAWNRQQKELQRQTEMINRLSGGGQAGRAEAAKKAMAKMREEGAMVRARGGGGGRGEGGGGDATGWKTMRLLMSMSLYARHVSCQAYEN